MAVAILDAGAQYGKVIDRRVRALGVRSELLPLNTPAKQLQHFEAIIISGGPQSVFSDQAPAYDPELFSLPLPILGICYGMQLLAHVAGNQVSSGKKREDGPCDVRLETTSSLFQSLNQTEQVLMSHGDAVTNVVSPYRACAWSGDLIAAIEDPEHQRFGVQFHPEVDLTVHGMQIFENFLFSIAHCQRDWTVEDREQAAIEMLRQRVGEHDKVIALLSGGVDSTVCVALARKALKPEQIIALHIDTGFMREQESALVVTALEKLGVQVRVLKAESDFLQATTKLRSGEQSNPLNQVIEPEQKRQIIGDAFVKVTEQALEELDITWEGAYLLQGSLRPDLIESASTAINSAASTIKTHHNDAALIRALRERGRVLEPLAEYHKDEVRVLGKQLGLPEALIWRQPFPGPGLAIRILCAREPYMKDYQLTLEAVDTAISNLAPEFKARLLPIKTVGVQGDGRTYSYAVALWHQDFERLAAETFTPNKQDETIWQKANVVARELPKVVHGVNRVIALMGGEISTVAAQHVVPTLLSQPVVSQLRAADAVVERVLQQHTLQKQLSQVPVILLPLDFSEASNNKHTRSIVIRPFITNDFMTGLAAIPGTSMFPWAAAHDMVKGVLALPTVARVAFDLTSKPPGTTEWE